MSAALQLAGDATSNAMAINLVPKHDAKGSRPRGRLPELLLHSEWSKAAILRRDPYCKIRRLCDGSNKSTDVDHIVPKSKGGADDPSNLQGACHPCHSHKTAKYDGGFGHGKAQ